MATQKATSSGPYSSWRDRAILANLIRIIKNLMTMIAKRRKVMKERFIMHVPIRKVTMANVKCLRMLPWGCPREEKSVLTCRPRTVTYFVGP